MTSALACVGLAVSDETELQQLVTRAHRAAGQTGVFDGVHVGRWEDDSGAALVLGWRSGELLDFIPAYTAGSGGLLADCRLINDAVAVARVVDTGGQQLTAMTFQAEQYRELRAHGEPVSGPARITALGTAVQVYPDAAAFAASPGSQLDLPAGQEPPPHYRERGWTWPPRLGAESFISYGVFGDPDRAGPRARLSGIVLTAAQRVCALTGQPFAVATVSTAGFAADVCLAASEHPGPPAPGSVISGTVSLSAAFVAPLPCCPQP
ncbi:MAG: hypothetical protein ACRDPF_21150 [Streptosporangiaceae bacterium]